MFTVYVCMRMCVHVCVHTYEFSGGEKKVQGLGHGQDCHTINRNKEHGDTGLGTKPMSSRRTRRRRRVARSGE